MRIALAFVPLAAAVAASLAVGLGGVHARGLVGSAIEPWAFGYFVDRFPLFGALLVYGATRIVLLATIAPGGPRFARLALLPVALALVLLPGLHPTFGGVVIRAAYFTGGMAFLQGAPTALAYPVGALVSTVVFAAGLGAGAALARLAPKVGPRALGEGAARVLATWFAALVVAAPTALGLPLLGDFPAWPMTPGESVAAAGLVLIALAPHALIVARSGR